MAGRSDNKVIISILGVDLTKGTFAKVGRAVARFGAVAAGVGVAGAVAIGKAAQELSVLSDRAAQANTSADALQRLSTAMGVLGVKGADIESVTRAMTYMTKNTGRTGVSGLKDTLVEISQLSTEGQRVQALMKSLGKEGAGFAALVGQGPDAIRQDFDTLLAAMPALSNELTDAGDSIADGMNVAMQGVKNAWNEVLMRFASGIKGSDESFRELGTRIAHYAVGYGAIAYEKVKEILVKIMNYANYVAQVVKAVFTDATFADARAELDALNAVAEENYQREADAARSVMEAGINAAKKLDEITSKYSGRGSGDSVASALGAGASMRTGAGSLIQANSYAALRTTVFSPLRTMTGYLADIVRNTSATTDAIEELPATA